MYTPPRILTADEATRAQRTLVILLDRDPLRSVKRKEYRVLGWWAPSKQARATIRACARDGDTWANAADVREDTVDGYAFIRFAVPLSWRFVPSDADRDRARVRRLTSQMTVLRRGSPDVQEYLRLANALHRTQFNLDYPSVSAPKDMQHGRDF